MDGHRDCVLVLAPTGRDGALIGEMLKAESLGCDVCRTIGELAAKIRGGAALALVTEEGLTGVPLTPLMEALAAQPAWSDFPLIFLTASGTYATDASEKLLAILKGANLSILEKPIRVTTLLSGIRSALRARHRQYQVRDYLEESARNEENLRQTQKLESLGVLAGGVAHDFNNLLTGILGNASLAMECLQPANEQARSLLEDVVHASERAAFLTRQLLAYAGKGRFVIETLDLSEQVRTTAHLIQTSIARNACVELDLARDIPPVQGDAAQIQQIVMNLLLNAAESIPSDRMGQVRISTRAEHWGEAVARQNFAAGEITVGDYVVLRVEDTGEGMDDTKISRIFDPFFTTKFMGRGLGLAAVLGIVRSHQAALKVRSVPNEGSVFEVFFPASAAGLEKASRPVESARDMAARGATILIVDDEETIRRTARLTLTHYGYNTLVACGGAEGIEIFRKQADRIQAVLLDLTMPGLTGDEVFAQLREMRPNLKVILSSGFDEMEVVERFSGTGLAGFIQKPYSSAALASKVAEVLSKPAVLT